MENVLAHAWHRVPPSALKKNRFIFHLEPVRARSAGKVRVLGSPDLASVGTQCMCTVTPEEGMQRKKSLPNQRSPQTQNGPVQLGQAVPGRLYRAIQGLPTLSSTQCFSSHLRPVRYFQPGLWRGLDCNHRLLLEVAHSTNVLVGHIGQCRDRKVKKSEHLVKTHNLPACRGAFIFSPKPLNVTSHDIQFRKTASDHNLFFDKHKRPSIPERWKERKQASSVADCNHRKLDQPRGPSADEQMLTNDTDAIEMCQQKGKEEICRKTVHEAW